MRTELKEEFVIKEEKGKRYRGQAEINARKLEYFQKTMMFMNQYPWFHPTTKLGYTILPNNNACKRIRTEYGLDALDFDFFPRPISIGWNQCIWFVYSSVNKLNCILMRTDNSWNYQNYIILSEDNLEYIGLSDLRKIYNKVTSVIDYANLTRQRKIQNDTLRVAHKYKYHICESTGKTSLSFVILKELTKRETDGNYMVNFDKYTVSSNGDVKKCQTTYGRAHHYSKPMLMTVLKSTFMTNNWEDIEPMIIDEVRKKQEKVLETISDKLTARFKCV